MNDYKLSSQLDWHNIEKAIMEWRLDDCKHEWLKDNVIIMYVLLCMSN